MHVKFGALSIGIALCLTTSVCRGNSAVQWQPTLDRAKIMAAHSNRLVLVHFWGNGCRPCEWMDREVFTRPDVVQAIDRGFVAVRINRDQSPGDARQFGIAAVPADVIITPQGQVLAGYVGGTPAPEYIARLDQVAQRGLPAGGPQYAGATWPTPTQTAFSPQTPPMMQPQPSGNYPLGGLPNGIGQAGPSSVQQGQVPGQAWPAQAVPPYAEQYGMGSTASPSYPMNPQSAPTGMSPALEPTLPAAAPPAAQNVYAVNPQMAPANTMASTPAMASPAAGQPLAAAPPAGNPPIALEGFCPVSLERTMRCDPQPKWVPGDPRWGLRHEGRTYLFAGPEQQKAFFENPNLYAPVLSGNDVVLQVERGQQVAGVREFGARWRDRVYLFSNRESFEKFQANPVFYENQILGSQQAVAGPTQSPAQSIGTAPNPYGYR